MQEELYLRKIDDTYEVFVKDLSDKSIPYHLEYPFREAAVVIVYPDGRIDALRVTEKYSNHFEYYRELFKTSRMFATEVRKRAKAFNLMKETITSSLDNLLAKDGIAVFQNLDMEYINEYGLGEGECSEFLSYLPEEGMRTRELSRILDAIMNNYDTSKISENVYNPKFGRCKGIEKENIR